MSLRGVILLLWFIPSLPFCFVRPFYGIVMWMIIAFLNPQWYTYGSGSLLPWALCVAIPTLAGFFLFNRGWSRLLKSRETYLIIILWSWFTVTTMISTSTPLFMHHASDTWAEWVFVSKIMLMTLVTVGIVNSFERLRTLVIVIASCFGFFVAKALPFLILTGGNTRVFGPERSMISDNNDFGLALNMTAPLFFFLAQSEPKPWAKRVFGALFTMVIPTIFFTYSRGALLGLIVVIGLMVVRLKQRAILIPIILVGAIVAVAFAPDGWKERMDPTREGAMDGSALSRLNAWKFARALASEYPITGGGFATWTQELFDRFAPNRADVKGPHSVYFGILGEHGYVGLVLYLTLVASCFLALRRTMKWARFHGDEVVMCYANMFQFSLVGFLSSGFFLGRAYFDYFFTIIACIAVLNQVCHRRWGEMDAETLLAEEPQYDSTAATAY